MAIDWSYENDFGEVVDGLQPVTIRRGDHGEEVVVDRALRFALEYEPSASGERSVREASWLLSWPTETAGPLPGDRLFDAQGICWRLAQVEGLREGRQWRCRARRDAVAQPFPNRVDIQEAIWQDLGSGLEIVGWQTISPAVPASVTPGETVVDRETAPITSKSTFRIVLSESDGLDHNHRIVDKQGGIYRVDRFLPAVGINALPEVEASLEVIGG